MIFSIYPFISHYAWVSLYRLFKLFGKILYSEDYIIVSLLTVVLCLFICDFIAKTSKEFEKGTYKITVYDDKLNEVGSTDLVLK